MKSELFKSAWAIKRLKNVSFSEALKTAWSAMKNGVKVFVNTTWNKKSVLTFSKANCFGNSVERVLEMLGTSSVPNVSGARFDYGKGTYNGD